MSGVRYEKMREQIFANQKPLGVIPAGTIDKTPDAGVDTQTPVDDSYKIPFRFNGTINN
jgi:hypothetical protein